MNILYPVAFFKPFEVGGTEISSRIYASKLAEMGEKIYVLTPNFCKFRLSYTKMQENFYIIRFPFLFNTGFAFTIFNSIFFLIYLIFLTLFCILRFRIDIIHIQSGVFFPAGILAAKILRKKVVLTVRDGTFFVTSGKIGQRLGLERHIYLMIYAIFFRPVNYLGRYLYRKADKIIAVSRYMETEAIKRLGLPPSRVLTIYNIYEKIPIRKSVRSKKKTMLFVGRLSRSKGFDLLLEAMEIIIAKMPEARLYAVGNSNLEKYRRIVNERGLRKNVTFLGMLEYEKVMNVYQKFDIVIMPSIREEPLSRVLIECSILGKPVVATSTGGTQEVIANGLSGILVDSHSEHLAKGILKFLFDESLKRKCMNGISKNVEMFAPERNCKRLKKLYLRVLD